MSSHPLIKEIRQFPPFTRSLVAGVTQADKQDPKEEGKHSGFIKLFHPAYLNILPKLEDPRISF